MSNVLNEPSELEQFYSNNYNREETLDSIDTKLNDVIEALKLFNKKFDLMKDDLLNQPES